MEPVVGLLFLTLQLLMRLQDVLLHRVAVMAQGVPSYMQVQVVQGVVALIIFQRLLEYQDKAMLVAILLETLQGAVVVLVQ
jgi:hypothetical protein